MTTNITINTSVPNLQPGIEDEYTKKSFTQNMISEAFPPDTWTHVFTGGSATDAIRDGGAGTLVSYTNGQSRIASIATGAHCTNYKADMQASSLAVTIAGEAQEQYDHEANSTDAKSVPETLINVKTTTSLQQTTAASTKPESCFAMDTSTLWNHRQ